MEKEKRNYSIDILKFFCILGVICIHVKPFGDSKYISSFITTATRVCVPLFFICSGYMLRNDKEYLKKYFMKMLKIFITWASIYIIYDLMIIIFSNLYNLNIIYSNILKYFGNFKISDIYYARGIIKYHLWFISALVFTIPFRYFIVKYKLINRALVLTLFLNLLGIYIPVFINNELWITVRDGLFLGLFYSVLGLFIKQNEEKIYIKAKQISNLTYYALIVVFLITTFCEKVIYKVYFNAKGDYFLSTILLATLLFTLCIIRKDALRNSAISKIGGQTLGIYLIHLLIMDTINLLIINTNLSKNFLYNLFIVPVILILSYLFYKYIKDIKFKIKYKIKHQFFDVYKNTIVK